ncbi:MAG: glycosyl transferase family 1 [Methanobacteriales archaeon Met13]
MKIGYFVSHFLYQDRVGEPGYEKEYAHGGTEIATYHLAREMARRGHQVEVFTTALDNRTVVEADRVTVHRYATQFRVASANFSWGLLRGPQKVEVDLAHAHYNMPHADYSALKYSQKRGVPLVVTYHADAPNTGGSFLRNQLQSYYNRHFLPRVLEQSDIIITTSKSYIDRSRFLGRYREKIRVIPNGIHLEEFQTNLSKEECRLKLGLPLDKKIILFFGNLIPYKGPDVLLRALAEVKKEYFEVQLLYVGRGPLKSELRSLARKLGVEEDVNFSGYVSPPLKALYYQAADIFCLPSVNLAEAFGIVNLEAMASGLPIIASDLGGIPDIVVDGENGLTVPPGDVNKLGAALLYLIENQAERRKMGQAGMRKVQDYSWEKIAGKVEAIYHELVD